MNPGKPSYEELERQLADAKRDSARLDWLERYINREGSLLIHTGEVNTKGFWGLGLRPGSLRRTLRQALDVLETH